MAHIIDGIVIGILVVCTFIGSSKGALKSITSLFGSAISLAFAIFVVIMIGNEAYEIPFINKLFAGDNGSLASFFASKLPDFNGITVGATTEEIKLAIGGLWSVIVPMLTSVIDKMSGGVYHGCTINYALSRFFAQAIFYVALTFLIYIVLRIIIRALEKLIDKIKTQKTINDVDKFFGLIVGFVKGMVIVSVLLVVFGLLLNFSFMAPVKAAFEQTYIAKELSKIVFAIVSYFFNTEKLLGGLAGAA
ncbi:MAG TPA: CvpA family protein [Clostridia bacterium]